MKLGASVVGPNEERQSLVATCREVFPNGVYVFNFSVSEFHTYFISDTGDDSPLLVHNASGYNTSGNTPPLKGSGGPGKVYVIPGEQLKGELDYIGKTKQPKVTDRMKSKDHNSKTKAGTAPDGIALAEDLTIEEMDGVEGILIDQNRPNLGKKMQGRDFSLEKNKSRLQAGKRVIGGN